MSQGCVPEVEFGKLFEVGRQIAVIQQASKQKFVGLAQMV